MLRSGLFLASALTTGCIQLSRDPRGITLGRWRGWLVTETFLAVQMEISGYAARGL